MTKPNETKALLILLLIWLILGVILANVIVDRHSRNEAREAEREYVVQDVKSPGEGK